MDRKGRLITLAFAIFAVVFWLCSSSPEPEGAHGTRDRRGIELDAGGNDTVAAGSSASPSSPVARALRQVRASASDGSNAVASCPTPAFVDSGKETYQVVWPLKVTVAGSGRERYGGRNQFSCSGAVPWDDGRDLKSCGDDVMKYMHPFVWECRLKERLLAEIERAGLAEGCGYGFLDVGSALGDWVIALGGRHPEARLASAEADPETVVSLLRNYRANGLLEDGRVNLYPFAVGVSNSTSNNAGKKWGWTDVIWPELGRSKFVSVLNWPGSTLCMPMQSVLNLGGFATTGLAEEGASGCGFGEMKVPVASVDDIVNDWQSDDGGNKHLAYGGLFAAKVDVEGAEAGVIESAAGVFSNPGRRPCIMYFELKRGGSYEEAFRALLDLGYGEVLDVDSGRAGEGSYPPVGRLYPNEGNYEFRLPEAEFEECAARVRRAACR